MLLHLCLSFEALIIAELFSESFSVNALSGDLTTDFAFCLAMTDLLAGCFQVYLRIVCNTREE